MPQQRPFRVSNVEEGNPQGERALEQEQALHAVLNRHTPPVVLLLTGGGKSLLCIVLVCLADAGVIVVVVPY